MCIGAFGLPWRFMSKAFGANTFKTPNATGQPEPHLVLPQNAGGCRCCHQCCPHIWLAQNQIAKLYDTTQQNITQHIDGRYKNGELG